MDTTIVGLTLVGIALVATTPLLDYDVWWHMAIGRLIWQTGSVPRTEVFGEFIAGDPVRLPYALGDLPFYALFEWGGVNALVLAKVAFITGLFAAIWVWKGRGLPSWWVAPVLLLGAVTMGERMYARPEIYSWALAVALGVVLERSLQQPHWGLVVPLLFILWANLHQGWPLGAAMLVVFWFAQALRAGSGCGATVPWCRLASGAWPSFLVPLALLCNPYGIVVLTGALRSSSSQTARGLIAEWRPWWIEPPMPPVYLHSYFLLMVLALGVLIAAHRHVAWHWLGWLFLAIALSFAARRLIALVGLLAPLAVLDTLRRQHPRERRSTIKPQTALLVLIVLFCAARWMGIGIDPAKSLRFVRLGLYSETVPISEAAFVRARRLPGPLFNGFAHGGYLIWSLYPDYRVYIDSRQTPYPDPFQQEYFDIVSAGQPGWEQILLQRDVRTLIIPLEQRRLIVEAYASPRWTLVYAGNAAVIFLRRTPTTAALCDSLQLDLAQLPQRLEWRRYDRPSRRGYREPYPMPILRLAELCRQLGRPDVARAVYREVFLRRPDCTPATLNLAACEAEAGDTTMAVQLCRHAVRRGAGRAAWELLARLHRERGEPEAATLAEKRRLP